MTKKELVEALSKWPDDAEVEIGIPVNPQAKEPMMEDKIWFNIDMVEDINLDPKDDNKHCLIFGGRITME